MGSNLTLRFLRTVHSNAPKIPGRSARKNQEPPLEAFFGVINKTKIETERCLFDPVNRLILPKVAADHRVHLSSY